MSRREIFLRAVLGADGAAALQKLAKQSPSLDTILTPRAVLSWLNALPSYEGAIPGVEKSVLGFEKIHDHVRGRVRAEGVEEHFQYWPVSKLAAVVVASLGNVEPMAKAMRDVDLARLGRTVDLLVTHRLLKNQQPGRGVAVAPLEPKPPVKEEDFKEDIEDPKPVKPKLPRSSKKTQTIRMQRSELERPCSVCSHPQLIDARFTGCYCLRDLAKSVNLDFSSKGVAVTFGADWDADAVLTLLEAVGRR